MDKHMDLLNKYLRNEASASEKKRLQEYLNMPDIFFDDYLSVWNRAQGEMPKSVDKRLWDEINRKIKYKTTYEWKNLFCYAASGLIVILITLSAFLYNKINIQQAYEHLIVEVDKGQKSKILLPDGTKVQLNSDSKLIYGKNFNEKERTVELIGEGYFEVAKHKAPFNVKAGKIQIQALGTVFNVKAYPADGKITTFLVEGKVRLNSEQEAIMLSPGEVAEYLSDTHKMITTMQRESALYVSWVNNLFFFENEKLEDIIPLLERSYNVSFLIKDTTLKKHPFSGTLQNTSLKNVLDILSISANLNYKITNNEIELSRK